MLLQFTLTYEEAEVFKKALSAFLLHSRMTPMEYAIAKRMYDKLSSKSYQSRLEEK